MSSWPTIKRGCLALSLLAVIGLAVFAFAEPIFAQTAADDSFGLQDFENTTELGAQDIRVTVAKIIRAVLGLLGIIVLVIVIYGGYMYMTAGGQEEKITTAKKILVNGAIGLVIILSSLAITQFILSRLADATGFGRGGEDERDDTCLTFGACNPPIDECAERHFVIKSITPSTPNPNDPTGMSNIVVRALFSRPVNSLVDVQNAITLKTDGGTELPWKGGARKEDGYVIEAVFDGTEGEPEAMDLLGDDTKWKIEGDAIIRDLGDAARDKAALFEVRTGPGKMIYELAASEETGAYSALGWEMKASSYKFELVVTFDTEAELSHSLIYSTLVTSALVERQGDAMVGYLPLGALVDGLWHTVRRDIVKDFKELFPEVAIERGVVAVTIIGMTGARIGVDNLILGPSVASFSSFERLLPDNYETSVSQEIISQGGEVLEWGEVEEGCVFPSSAKFTVDADKIDSTPPDALLMVDGNRARNNMILTGGERHVFHSLINDESGFAYTHLNISNITRRDRLFEEPFNVYDGPRVDFGSSAEFPFARELTPPGNPRALPAYYLMSLETFDIDHNRNLATSTFVVLGGNCDPETGEPVAPEFADECLIPPGGDCAEDWQCSSQVCDELTSKCLAWPMITNVDPWDGAEKNWITISGRYFGEQEGTVNFGYEVDGETKWVLAKTPAECRGITDPWTDTWIIVEVPTDFDLPIDALSSIRVSRKDQPTFQDSTTDSHGPQPGDRDFAGWFTKNNIKRPGLCYLGVAKNQTTADGEALTERANAAPPNTELDAFGVAFGAERGGVKFKVKARDAFVYIPGEITSWQDDKVGTRVPESADKGRLLAHVTSTSGYRSNEVPFTVTEKGKSVMPFISSIIPTSTSPGSFVTVFGTRFGNNQGTAWLSDSPANAVKCLDSQTRGGVYCERIDINSEIYGQCEDSWHDNQVIVLMPAETSPGAYYIILETAEHLATTGDTSIEITEDPPAPGICSLVPIKGLAPLPESSEPLVFGGLNFSENPKVYFPRRYLTEGDYNFDFSDFSTWLNSTQSDDYGTVLVSVSDTEIRSRIPAADGVSMESGPLFVVSKDGEISNPVFYTVSDCREDIKNGVEPPHPVYRCCESGEETGLWKHESYACAGEIREAGYVWRFTTGKIPNAPQVAEECNEIGWNDAAARMEHPSPVPWEQWDKGKEVCVNANVAVRFIGAPAMDALTLTEENVRLFKCNSGEDKIDDSECEAVGLGPLGPEAFSGAQVLTILANDMDAPKLEPDTWYRVELSRDITSYNAITVAGRPVIERTPLRATRPCGGDSAYCFDFRTSPTGERCTLIGAFITPAVYTAYSLGRIRDPFSDLIYQVLGKGSQECSVLNVAGMDWRWRPQLSEDTDFDKAALLPLSDTPQKDKRLADAKKHTAPDKVDISAEVPLQRSSIELAKADLWATLGLAPEQKLSFTSPADSRSIPDIQNLFTFYSDTTMDVSFRLNEISWEGAGTKTRILLEKEQEFQITVEEQKLGPDRLRYLVVVLNSFGLGSGGHVRYQFDIKNPGESWKFDLVKLKVDVKDREVGIFVNGTPLTSFTLIGDFTEIRAGSPLVLGGWQDRWDDTVLYGSVESLTFVRRRTAAPNVEETITAQADLTINLGDAKVIDYWPRCTTACIDAGVGASFNRQMSTSTYGSGVKVYECPDERCEVGEADRFNDIVVDEQHSDEKILALNLRGNSFFSTSTWYLVELTSTIKMIGGYNDDGTIREGEGLKPFSWKFRTKADDSPCIADSVVVEPISFVAYFVGERTDYRATPFGEPDECTTQGQRLNPWNFDWSWLSADTKVAKVTNFSASRESAEWCTSDCLPKGSDISRDLVSPALCGNGKVDAGEDCDIASSGEVVGVSCTYECLRPGSSAEACGNGEVESALGEECDPTIDQFCTDQCVWQGSSASATGAVNTPVCGSGTVTPGEDCDTADPATRAGCSSQCLHLGAPLSNKWCVDIAEEVESVPEECSRAVTVCGNGVIESGEECEINGGVFTAETCDVSCLLKNACDLTLPPRWCEEGAEGCNDDCSLAGSSINYSVPSFCGDGAVGMGEHPRCEIGGGDRFGLPIQIVEAVGESRDVDLATQSQSTTIYAETRGYKNREERNTPLDFEARARGRADYYLQCSYEEFASPQGDPPRYNDCPNTSYGVGINSCCYPRPMRQMEYPEDGAENVCRNTAIEATFDGYLDPKTIINNVFLAEATSTFATCLGGSSADVTDIAEQILADASSDAFSGKSVSIWSRLWGGVKRLLARLVGLEAYAQELSPVLDVVEDVLPAILPTVLNLPGLTGVALPVIVPDFSSRQPTVRDLMKLMKARWCATDLTFTTAVSYDYSAAGDPNSIVELKLNEPLRKETRYAIFLRGGKNGIADDFGVGIKHPTASILDDGWQFETGSNICRLAKVKVNPDSYLFTKPYSTSTFEATAISENEQRIVTTTVYDWKWSWLPSNNPVFDIPPVKYWHTSTTAKTVLGARNLEGTLLAYAKAKVIADMGVSSDELPAFTGKTELVARFCNVIWPLDIDRNGINWKPFEDTEFNFSMSYCADAGQLGNEADDLPLLEKRLELSPNAGYYEYGGVVVSKPFVDTYVGKDKIDVTDIATNIRQGQATGLNQDIINAESNILSQAILGGSLLDPALVQYIEPESVSLSKDILKRYLFFNNDNEDVIGIQIFTNPNRKTAAQWYTERYSNLGEYNPVSIHDFDAITNGNSYYINAFNEINREDSKRTLYNNIYHFSINEGAQALTRAVFEQLINSLRFNINIPEINYCLLSGDPGFSEDFSGEHQCATDFDCRDFYGKEKSGTIGVCGNGRSKLLRDWSRLHDIRYIQNTIDAEGDGYQELASGTYYPGYTVSKWGSWNNTLGKIVGSLPMDRINQWTVCGDKEGVDQQTCWDAASSTYYCPAFSSVYEYEFVSSSPRSYKIHAPLEYFNNGNRILNYRGGLLTSEFINFAKFDSEPWCRRSVESPFGEKCGDRVVQRRGADKTTGTVDDEECDPPGSAGMGNKGVVSFTNPGECNDGTKRSCVSNAGCAWSNVVATTDNPIIGSPLQPLETSVQLIDKIIRLDETEKVCLSGNDERDKNIIYQEIKIWKGKDNWTVTGDGTLQINEDADPERKTFLTFKVGEGPANMRYTFSASPPLVDRTVSEESVLRWDMDVKSYKFEMLVNLATNTGGSRSIVYSTYAEQAEVVNRVGYIPLGRLNDEEWHTVSREIVEDFDSLFGGEQATGINFIQIIGMTGAWINIDNLKLDAAVLEDGAMESNEEIGVFRCAADSYCRQSLNYLNPWSVNKGELPELAPTSPFRELIGGQSQPVSGPVSGITDPNPTLKDLLPMDIQTVIGDVFRSITGSANPLNLTQSYLDAKSGKFTCGEIGDSVSFLNQFTDETVACEGASADTKIDNCSAGERASWSCDNSCQFVYDQCQGANDCGNGIVERREKCDDGRLNGTYGHCADATSIYFNGMFVRACQGPHQQYCGNNTIDTKDGVPLEFCDTKLLPLYKIDGPAGTCALNCQGPGEYCGDGQVQYEDGETCDDKNDDNFDGCTNTCVDNRACRGDILNRGFIFRITGSGATTTRVAFNKKLDPSGLGLYGEYGDSFASCLAPRMNGNAICAAFGLPCKDGLGIGVNQFGDMDNLWSFNCNEEISAVRDRMVGGSIVQKVMLVNCTGEYKGEVTVGAKPTPLCGDGVMQTSTLSGVTEKCDLGSQNGTKCNPAYGKSCTYCSNDCEEILTVDAVEFCGDGAIQEQYESCDMYNGKVVSGLCLDPTFVIDFVPGKSFNPTPGQRQLGLVRFARVRYNSDLSGINWVSPANFTSFCTNSDSAKQVACQLGMELLFTASSRQHDQSKMAAGRCSEDWSLMCDYDPNSNVDDLDCVAPARDTVIENLKNIDWLTYNNIQPASAETRSYGICEPYRPNLYNCEKDAGKDILSCGDIGNISCSPGCGLVNECLECRQYLEGDVRGASPMINVMNVMIGNNKNTSSLGDGMHTLNAFLFRPDMPSRESSDIQFGNPEVSDKADSVFERFSPRTIETNQLCAQKYKLMFNVNALVAEIPEIDSSTDKKRESWAQRISDLGAASLFDYPVSGEKEKIENEMIISPAAPEGVYRVVVRWTDKENKESVMFGGRVYNRNMTVGRVGSEASARVIGASTGFAEACEHTNCLSPRAQWPAPRYICDVLLSPVFMTQEEASEILAMRSLTYSELNYWWLKTSTDGSQGCTTLADKQSVYFHSIGSLSNTFTQAITIDTNRFLNPRSPIAFFVEAISPLSKPIAQFADSELTVEIYNYHERQYPAFSLYKPARVFQIQPAQETSSNQGAKYWHVFNLVYDSGSSSYVVQSVKEPLDQTIEHINGSIETDFCSVRNNVPGESCNPADAG